MTNNEPVRREKRSHLAAYLILLLLGIFCVFVPQTILVAEYLPSRYSNMSRLGDVFFYLGMLLTALAIVAIIRTSYRILKKSR